MLMSEETRAKLNEVLTDAFALNMFCDNAVYQIDYDVYPKTADLVHHAYAHYWPAFADKISDMMIRLNAKPVRLNFTVDYEDYGGDLALLFKRVAEKTKDYRNKIKDAIELAELNDDPEVKLFLEEMILELTPYRKQADIWAVEAERYKDNYKSFDARISTFTTAIPI